MQTAENRKKSQKKYMLSVKEYHKEWMRQYSVKNRERMRINGQRFRDNCKKRCFEVLGKQCICCNETQIKFLQIDHINGGGRKEKRTTKKNYIFRKIELEGFPKDKYQILCSNCNWAKGIYGICPHQEKK